MIIISILALPFKIKLNDLHKIFTTSIDKRETLKVNLIKFDIHNCRKKQCWSYD